MNLKIFTENIEQEAFDQILNLVKQPAFQDCKVRIMPDVHAGKGNEDWNCSAPHGAGRLMSRNKAKESISLDEFEKSMEGIYTTSVNQSTIDESPMAYKSIDDIVNNISDTVEILDIAKPIYNFKASE